MKPEVSTAWAPCETERPKGPEFTSIDPSMIPSGKEVSAIIIVKFNAKKGEAFLITPCKKSLELVLTPQGDNTWKTKIPELKEGSYKLYLTNSKGLDTTIEGALSVQDAPPVIPSLNFIVNNRNYSKDLKIILKGPTLQVELPADGLIPDATGVKVNFLKTPGPGQYEVYTLAADDKAPQMAGTLQVSPNNETLFTAYVAPPTPPKTEPKPQPAPLPPPKPLGETAYPFEVGLGWDTSRILGNPWGSLYNHYNLAGGDLRLNYFFTPHGLKGIYSFDWGLENLTQGSVSQTDGDSSYLSNHLLLIQELLGPSVEFRYSNFYTHFSILAGLGYAKCMTSSSSSSTVDFTAGTQLNLGYRIGSFSFEGDFGYSLMTMTRFYQQITAGVRLIYAIPVQQEITQ